MNYSNLVNPRPIFATAMGATILSVVEAHTSLIGRNLDAVMWLIERYRDVRSLLRDFWDWLVLPPISETQMDVSVTLVSFAGLIAYSFQQTRYRERARNRLGSEKELRNTFTASTGLFLLLYGRALVAIFGLAGPWIYDPSDLDRTMHAWFPLVSLSYIAIVALLTLGRSNPSLDQLNSDRRPAGPRLRNWPIVARSIVRAPGLRIVVALLLVIWLVGIIGWLVGDDHENPMSIFIRIILTVFGVGGALTLIRANFRYRAAISGYARREVGQTVLGYIIDGILKAAAFTVVVVTIVRLTEFTAGDWVKSGAIAVSITAAVLWLLFDPIARRRS